MRIDRGARIDEARGIATLLVVMFHASRAEPSLAAGLFYHVNEALILVRMPLFMIVTGFLLGRRATTAGVGAALRSLRPWIVRIVWPLVTVTIVCVAILHGRGEPWPIARALLFGVWHLWYLQALILLKIAYVAIDARWRCGGACRAVVGIVMPAVVARWAREWRAISAIPIGLPAPRRRRPDPDPTMSGYRSALRRFASGMNHPC